MAVAITPIEQITGLTASGTTDALGTWNTSVDLTGTPYNVPSDASGILLQFQSSGAGAKFIGARDPSDTTARSGFLDNIVDRTIQSFVVPVDSGTVDIYAQSGVDVFLAGYFESGAISWLAGGSEITRATSSTSETLWDFTADDASATGIVLLNSSQLADDRIDFSFAVATGGTASDRLRGFSSTHIGHYVVPLDSEQRVYITSNDPASLTYNIAGFIHQDITTVYDDAGGPDHVATSLTWAQADYDYGTEAGIGCQIPQSQEYASNADATNPFETVDVRLSFWMHTVDSSGNFNYITASSATHQPIWFMGAAAGDATAPVLTSPTAGSLTTDGVTPSVTTDEGNGTLYWGIYADAASPTAAQVVAGTSAILSGSQAVSGTGSQAVSAQTGLDDATSYELFFVHDDAAANRSNLSTVGFTTSTDSTAPSLTSPTAGSVTSTSVAPTVTTDTAEGTAYARVYADGATPTNSQVQSGTGVTPVGSATNITVGASGALNFSAITGLTEGTAYELYFVHVDAATTPNLSAVSTVGFTTTAAVRTVELTGANGYELRDETGAVVASLNGIIWEWYDDPDSTAGSPTDSGTFNTDAGGEATITITGSSLADGAFGTLWVRHPTDDEIRGNYYLPMTVS